MKIRKLQRSEIDISIEMSEYSFQYELSEEEREERRRNISPEDSWVVEDDGKILAKATVLPLMVHFQEKQVSMGGVSSVATWPEYRRSGLVKDLLFQCLIEMKEKGQLLSFLAPFSIPFYRKFGWELFAEEQKLTLTKEQLPVRKPTAGSIKRVEKDYQVIRHVYEEWASRFNGTLIRDEKWWKRLISRDKKDHLAIYYTQEGDPKGYMFYQIKSQTLTIDELIWLDPESRDGLFTFIANHDSMIDKVVWTTTPNDGIPFLLPDPKVEREIISYFMARIVDVKEFLKVYPFQMEEGSSPIILHLTDEFCSWNDGTYFIEMKQNQIKTNFFSTKGSSGANCQHPPKKGIRLSIQTLTALLFNAQSMDVLYREGLVLGEEEQAKKLENAIKSGKPFIYDFF
ncbi:putative acetyltransferase [Evansella vedderi]|uniref:Acetyltransferase n=1 Tax=Evansella vedderi TaxID=38282 RepID=A0ABT9ZRV5_9BACI|nr:GNAT family N-acetyltransferase [Evansella vedderi]MDQ0253965.1 putative acetyltransferase [Evansella vedderi]